MHMNFSEEAAKSYFFSQPHQPFFVLAFVNAIVAMLIFMLAFIGVITLKIPTGMFHGYTLIHLLFTPAFSAFLLTTFPRFTATPAIAKEVYMRIFSLFYIGSILLLLGSLVSPVLAYGGMLILFGGHTWVYLLLRKIYTTSTMPDNRDVFWIQLWSVNPHGNHP